jgi:hypothetical protein
MGGIYDVDEMRHLVENDEVDKPLILTATHATTMTEGVTYTVTLYDTRLSSDTIDWTLLGPAANNDVLPILGSVTLSNGNGSFDLTPTWDYVTDPNESFFIRFTDPDTGHIHLETTNITIIDVYQEEGSGDTYPVANPDLQWYFKADDIAVGTSFPAGTILTVPNGFSGVTLQEEDWRAQGPMVAYPYTNSLGVTKRYLQVPHGSNFQARTNTYDGNAIINNSGFTFSYTCRTNITNSWHRVFNYFGSATPSQSIYDLYPTSTSQYNHFSMFYNKQSTRIQMQIPYSAANSNYYLAVSGVNWLPNMIATFVVSLGFWGGTYGNNTGVYSLRLTDLSTGTTTNKATNATFNTGGTPISVQAGTDVARPFFNDSVYGGSSAGEIIASSFANRPYTTSEMTALMDYMTTEYH